MENCTILERKCCVLSVFSSTFQLFSLLLFYVHLVNVVFLFSWLQHSRHTASYREANQGTPRRANY
jgi:hypothetical protein